MISVGPMAVSALPEKLFFKIGEVADIVGVKPHVLRYWETEFQALRPMKTRGSHRVYKRRDVELAMLIRRLLHDEGYTIPGARKRLREEGRNRVGSAPEPHAAREVALRSELLEVRTELEQLMGYLTTIDHPSDAQVTNDVSSPPRDEALLPAETRVAAKSVPVSVPAVAASFARFSE